jgi:hydroxyacylglutathione hydrolase
MFLRMVYDDKLAEAAYLIGCQRTGEAIVIDPERDVDRYEKLAAANGLRIVAVAETHIHADFVSGGRELAEKGATMYVSDEGDADWKYQWLDRKLGGGSYRHRLLKGRRHVHGRQHRVQGHPYAGPYAGTSVLHGHRQGRRRGQADGRRDG